MTKITILIAAAIIIVSTNAMALNINGQAQKVGVRIDNSTHKNEAVSRAYAATILTTSDCLMGGSMGVQAEDFGISIGGTKKAKPCNWREIARLLLSMGYSELAYLTVACTDKEVKELSKNTKAPCPNLKIEKKKEACDYPTEQCKKSRR